MSAGYRSHEELEEIAMKIMESLRPEHLTVGQIKDVAQILAEGTEYIVLRERPNE